MAAQSTDPIDCALIQPKSDIVYEYAAAMALRLVSLRAHTQWLSTRTDL
jgi:hypothetical protein